MIIPHDNIVTEPCPEWKDMSIVDHELSNHYDNHDNTLSGESDNYFSEEDLENDKYDAKYTPDV